MGWTRRKHDTQVDRRKHDMLDKERAQVDTRENNGITVVTG